MLEHFRKGMSEEQDEAEKKREDERKAKERRARLTEKTQGIIQAAYTELWGEYQGQRLPKGCEISSADGELIVRNNKKPMASLVVSANGGSIELKNGADRVLTTAETGNQRLLEEFWERFGREIIRLLE